MSSYYNQGTASLTNGSATVTFAGAALNGVVYPGDLFNKAGVVYVVAGVVSDTQITLASAYLGATETGAAYVISFTAGRDAQVSADLASLLATFSGIADGPGAGKFASGTAAAPAVRASADLDSGLYFPAADQVGLATAGIRRLLLSSAALQIDLPISGTAVQANAKDATPGRLLKTGAAATVLAATPALRVATSGTDGAIAVNTGAGLTPTAGLRLRFRRGVTNTGTASIALDGGAAVACRTPDLSVCPAGYIRTDVDTVATFDGTFWILSRETQRGDNANGAWVRFEDGTQMVWANVTTPFAGAAQSVVVHTLPAAFVAAPNNPVFGENTNIFAARAGNVTATTVAVVGFTRDGSVSNSSPFFSMFAIGPWF